MVEENNINEFAVIFNRLKTEHESIIQFVPVKVVEGYYCKENSCFIDANQNVYPHMASLSSIGNAYAARINIYNALSEFDKMSLTKIKEEILNDLLQYSFFKIIDESSEQYCQIQMYNNETGELALFNDQDTPAYYNIDESNYPLIESDETSDKRALTTPIEIVKEIRKTIKGQDEALNKIATVIWAKYNMPKMNRTNMLIVGPHSCGKTTIFKKIKEKYDIPLSLYSFPSTFSGNEIEEMLLKLYYDSNMDIDKAKNGIIVIDNFEEISSINNNYDEIINTIMQNELLKIFEGTEKTIKIDEESFLKIDTSNITFICCGSAPDKSAYDLPIGFSIDDRITKQEGISTIFENGSVKNKLFDFLPISVYLNDISKDKDVLKEILLTSDESPLYQFTESFTSFGITVSNFDLTIDSIITDALNKNYNIKQILNITTNILLQIMEKVGNGPNKYSKLIVGNNITDNYSDYKLIPRVTKVKKKLKTKI